MKIGIDARMYGPSVGGGGLGRYVEQLVHELQTQPEANRYVLFLKKENEHTCPTAPFFEKRLADIHWYTFREQLTFGRLIDQENLDLIHFPHWNVPIGIKTPFVVTIHDLILLDEPHSSKVTTRGPLLFAIKYAAYRYVLRHALQRAKKIIAVSTFTKHSIIKHFPEIPAEKIQVVYEGVTPLLQPTTHNLQPTNPPYLLYVGNAYPHKNLETLLKAFALFRESHPNISLLLAGRKDVFYERLERLHKTMAFPKDAVRFLFHPTDEMLSQLYHEAHLYVFPSRIEGFGLPPLEAMQAGIPVASSNGGSLPEILGNAAVYFDPNDITQMVDVIRRASDDKILRAQLVQNGFTRVTQFSWKTMTYHIRNIYEKVYHSKNANRSS